MPRFVKKPVEIEAIQWTGKNLREIINFIGVAPEFKKWFNSFEEYEKYVQNDRQVVKIFTLEGTMEAFPGDWVIREVKGEHYPCKPDIFEAIYEPVTHKF